MRRKVAERGEGNFGCILWAVLLGVVVLVAFKVVPVKISSAEMYDFMDERAKFAANNTPEQIQKAILDKAQQLRLPVDKDHVKIERIGDNIRMEVTYSVPVDLYVTTWNWHFDHQIERPIFIF